MCEYPDETVPPLGPEIFRTDKAAFLALLDQWRSAGTLALLVQAIADYKASMLDTASSLIGDKVSADCVEMSRTYLLGELEQISHSHTLERAVYYIDRLIKGASDIRTSRINDINLNRWKEYGDILTDSLWLIDRRDSSGVHTSDYWGNFIPQIPHQMMKRYTKKGEWVLDTFAGSGTTLIEGQRLGRNTLGIELQPRMVDQAKHLVSLEPNPHGVTIDVVGGDSADIDYRAVLQSYGQTSVQLVIMHPPYFDIIRFSDDPRDLSNAADISKFLAMMGAIVENAARVLDKGRYLALVIGDKYVQGEWIPLGFRTMDEVLKRGFTLKSIVVKNFEETLGKRNQKDLWRYRALAGGYYIFKHEYIFVFRKS
ncbi:MAG: DNA methyltransferase [Anaerolineae bacterium]